MCNRGTKDMSSALFQMEHQSIGSYSAEGSLYYSRFLPYGGRALEGSNGRLQEELNLRRAKKATIEQTKLANSKKAKDKATIAAKKATKREQALKGTKATAPRDPPSSGSPPVPRPAALRPSGIRKPAAQPKAGSTRNKAPHKSAFLNDLLAEINRK